jgi:hypothetical protein
MMSDFKKLMNGEVGFRLPAEDRRLLDVLLREKRQQSRARNREVNDADVLMPLMRAWCRRPRHMIATRGRKSARVDVRLRFDQQLVCREFVGLLKGRNEKNASAVILALLREHLERNRKRLEDDARRFESAARQKRLRESARDSLAAAINVFMPRCPNGI